MLKLVILPLIKRYWYHLVLISLTAMTAVSIRGCINERDNRIRENAARGALIIRDSLQVAAIRDSLVLSRKDYDSTAKALRSALHAYNLARQASGRSSMPPIERASLRPIQVVDQISAAETIIFCQEFLEAAEAYKIFADSTIAAQARIIDNQTNFPQTIVKKSSRGKLAATMALGLLGGYALAKSF